MNPEYLKLYKNPRLAVIQIRICATYGHSTVNLEVCEQDKSNLKELIGFMANVVEGRETKDSQYLATMAFHGDTQMIDFYNESSSSVKGYELFASVSLTRAAIVPAFAFLLKQMTEGSLWRQEGDLLCYVVE